MSIAESTSVTAGTEAAAGVQALTSATACYARNPDGHFDQPWWLVVCREGGSSDACVGYLFDPVSWPVG